MLLSRSVCIALLALTFSACAGLTGVEPTDVSAVEEGATRESVEAKLGKPADTVVTSFTEVQVYEYNRGSGPTVHPGGPGDILLRPDVALTFILISPLFHGETMAGQKGFLAISYSLDGRVIDFELHPKKRWALERLTARLQLRKGVDEGDAEAQYEYGLRLNDPVQSWRFKCLAAHQGHGMAQNALANYYRWGRVPVQTDLVRSYVWRTLSIKQGNPPAAKARELTIRKMTREQIAEADRFVTEWKPNPAECEL